MNRTDITVIISLSILALFIWLRDTVWMSSADDTLPILAAIPIFLWIGTPWHFREHSLPLSSKGILGFILFFLLGIITSVTFFLALGWTILLWTWLNSALLNDPSKDLKKLLVIPLMAFPWVSLDLDRLGWWFRLSGAWVTAHIFEIFGSSVDLEGTNILINHVLVNVEVACAGLNTLQSMLIAGTVVAYILLGNSQKFWWNLPFLFLMAWVSNIIRIIGVCIAAIFVSPEFAKGAFHQLGGWLILIFMFCLCWLFFAWQRSKKT